MIMDMIVMMITMMKMTMKMIVMDGNEDRCDDDSDKNE